MTDDLSFVTGADRQPVTLVRDGSAPASPQVVTHVTDGSDLFASVGMTGVTGVPQSRIYAHARDHVKRPTSQNLSPVTTVTATPWWAAAYETRTGAELRLAGDRLIPARHDCGRWILHGYDAPLMAVHVHLDPNPLTPQLEAACVILAIPTYRLWGNPGRWTCTPRHQPGLHYLGRAPSAADVVVLAAHRCDRPPLSAQQLRMTATTRPRPDQPPY